MKKIEIKLKKSPNSCIEKHRRTIRSFGFTKLNQVIITENSESVIGKVKQVGYLLEVREI